SILTTPIPPYRYPDHRDPPSFPTRRSSDLSPVPHFCRNRSTRPAVSTTFCLPVKNGWQTEQISTWMLFSVLRVWNVFPHAHSTVATWLSAWIPSFMAVPLPENKEAPRGLGIFVK